MQFLRNKQSYLLKGPFVLTLANQARCTCCLKVCIRSLHFNEQSTSVPIFANCKNSKLYFALMRKGKNSRSVFIFQGAITEALGAQSRNSAAQRLPQELHLSLSLQQPEL